MATPAQAASQVAAFIVPDKLWTAYPMPCVGANEPTFQPTNHPQSLQYLVSTGIAVVAPNVRGSRGYGKTYLAADDAMKRHESVQVRCIWCCGHMRA